ncbi:MAG TPA: short-chain dehydrogenase [Acidobacteria bacterium]|jgi:NAD(P)-dependent dehydrogenase (short-subunit alcohol dehydrogenase family)|nr:short-chain dehydrogenase [Acidobacteriota bacterium]MDP6373655.1 SDR family NAD(P)-dependent oxidoreductase [Vicinamibacterales bacterium]HAK56808.1 short-chain dehydrogenase [Acidobacteriota bacterium]|tara:strand:+ start:7550 stop:8311 length:762 start_codon:yes stop_codon:yes gene_type:complete
MKLDGKVALITGGNSGIGSATAALLAKEGATVVLTGRNQARGDQIAQAITEAGGRAIFLRADVRVADDCRQVIEQTLERFGRIDVLFNNAGVYHPRTVPECTEQEWDETIDSSLKGAFLMSKYALPSMIERGSGSIIHTSSGWGIQGGDHAAAYCAAKGGLVVMAKAMAIDHGPDGIRVNCVCPGDVDTPMLPDDAGRRGMAWDDYVAGASDRPLGRIGTTEEIARAVLFLASDDSSFITGEALVVDGGGIAG